MRALTGVQLSDVAIYLSSFHFGTEDGKPYIHLNDHSPYEQPDVWNEMKSVHASGARILITLGGAGGAYSQLFASFDEYYALLGNVIRAFPFISGIDLDVEESTTLVQIRQLIACLDRDYDREFIVTMAPIASAMVSDLPGLGGFVYKELYKTEEGKRINWFNVQAYGSFDKRTFDSIVENGYPPSIVVLGMLGDEYDDHAFVQKACEELFCITSSHPDALGAALWEYGDTRVNPILFGECVSAL